MKFTEVEQRAMKLVNEHHEIKFYEMVLCFALEELFTEADEIELSDYQFNRLLNEMTCYLADDYHESPWHVADALVALVKKHGADAVINGDCGNALEAELYKINSGSYEGE
jgi:hypothetical protein